MAVSGTWWGLFTGLCVKVTQKHSGTKDVIVLATHVSCVDTQMLRSCRNFHWNHSQDLHTVNSFDGKLVTCKFAWACAGKCAVKSLSILYLDIHRTPYTHCFSCSCPNSSCARNKQEQSTWTLGHGGKHAQQQQQQLSSIAHKVRGNPAVILDKYAALHGMKQQQSD